MSKEIFDRGLAIRKKVLGAEFVEKSFAAADDFNLPIRCFGNADEPVPVPFTNRFDNRLFDYSPRSCICD